MRRTLTSSRRHGIVNGYRSGLEEQVASQLAAAGIDAAYEGGKVSYVKPERVSKYTWDFRLPNGIIVETKGRFATEDRQKHLLIKAQHPELDIRFVFSNSKAKISKASKTTYASWCERYGFRFSDKLIPTAWLNETTA